MKEIDLGSYDAISHFAIIIQVIAAIETVAVIILGIILSIEEYWWVFIPTYGCGAIIISTFYTIGMLFASYAGNICKIKESLQIIAGKSHPQETNIFKNMNRTVNVEKKTTVAASKIPVAASKTPVATSKTPVNSSNAPTTIVKTTIECPSCFAQNDIHAQRCKECGCPLK